jgi:flagellar assembly protein FliH
VPVIKARDAETKVFQAEVLRLQDVEAEAQRTLDDARHQAEAILAEARARAERLRPEAHRAGLEAGRAEGLKSGLELGRTQAFEQARADFAVQHASLAAALAEALARFEAQRRSLLSQMERDVVALAGAIADRVIKRAVDVDPACVADNVREALQLIASRNRLEIRLHPQDLEQARRFAEDLWPAQQFQAVGFVPDETVGRGGVLLRTAGGQVDATIETQWMRILDEILADWQEHWLLSPKLMSWGEPAADHLAAEPAPDPLAKAGPKPEEIGPIGTQRDGSE